MRTVVKMLTTVVVGAASVSWYLSFHPHPLSNADSIFLVVSSFVMLFFAIQIWQIDCLKEDVAEFKPQAIDAKDFISIFVSPKDVRITLSSMATALHKVFNQNISLQGEDLDEQAREIKAAQSAVKLHRDLFWRAVNLAHRFVGVELRKSYRDYLSDRLSVSTESVPYGDLKIGDTCIDETGASFMASQYGVDDLVFIALDRKEKGKIFKPIKTGTFKRVIETVFSQPEAVTQ